MSSRTARDRARRASERAEQLHVEHMLAAHGVDIRCPHCGRPRAVGELRDWEVDVAAAGPDHPLLGGVRSLRLHYPQDELIGWCGPCGCFASCEAEHSDHR